MAANAATLQDRSERAARRVLRPAILLTVVLLHAVLLLLASRWQTRVQLRSEDSLIFLPLASHVQAPAETPAAPEAPRKKPSITRETQLIAIPKEQPPQPAETTTPAPIDWNAEAALTAKQRAQSAAEPGPRALDQHGTGLDFDGGLGPDPESKPEFGWYHARIHRIEALEGGGSILWLNDRCFIVMAGVIPFPMCGIGKIPARGDLFDHMHDAAAPEPEPHSNTAP
jgi:hypothetical protein